jgi:hypothetical protein
MKVPASSLAPADLALYADLFSEVVQFLRKLFIDPDFLSGDLVALHQRHVQRLAGGCQPVERRRRFT